MQAQLPPLYSVNRSRILLACTASVMLLPLLLPTWKTMAAGMGLPVNTEIRLTPTELIMPAMQPEPPSRTGILNNSCLPGLNTGTRYVFRTLEPPRNEDFR